MPRRIYLTYEELKPYLEFNHLFNPLWIYLTYEELKLCIGMNSPQLSI